VVFPETGEELEKTYATGFIFAPTSLDAPYSWGVPYEDSGIPINPPLGTVLLSTNYIAAPPKRQYRNVSNETGAWVVKHNQDKLGGRMWKRKGGRMLSWGPVAGFERYLSSDKQSGPIYYRGNWLTGFPDVATSETHHVLAVNYTGNTLFALVKSTGSSNLYVAKKAVDWETETADGPWIISSAFILPGGYAADELYKFGLVDINNSCNQAVVTSWAYVDINLADFTEEELLCGTTPFGYTAKTAEINISWDDDLTVVTEIVSESTDSIEQPSGSYAWIVTESSTTPLPDGITYANWYGCTEPDVSSSSRSSYISWSGSCEAVLSARYIEDSDDKTRITIKLEYSETGTFSSNTSWEWTPDGTGYFMLTEIASISNQSGIKRTTVSLLLDGGTLYSKDIYYSNYISSHDYVLHWSVEDGYLVGSAEGGYTTSLDENIYKIAVPVALAEARQGGFVTWNCRTGLVDSGYTTTLSGMVNDPLIPWSECDIIETGTSYNNDSTDQVFQYAWDSNDITIQTHSYTYTTPFVIVEGNAIAWSINPSLWTLNLYKIMWWNGCMAVSDTNNTAALWAPNLALVQTWVRPTTGTDLTPQSLPYWSGGDLLELASAQGDNQAISPPWGSGSGVGISGSSSWWGIIS
jgi:hypothetical protein